MQLQMPKQRIILIAGIILALLAVLMAKVYLDQERQKITQQARDRAERIQANQASVLVAKKDIAKGALVEPGLFEVEVIPNQFVQPQAVTSLERISGMIVVIPISKGEQVTLSKLSYSKQGGGLSEVTPIGKRAVTISVDSIAGLVGMIKPQDYVDVSALINIPMQTADGKQASQVVAMSLFQNVLVLAVGQDTGAVPSSEGRYKKDEKKEFPSTVTLALEPQEAHFMAFVQEQGKIHLTLRSPADSNVQPIQPASWDSLFQYIMPNMAGSKTKPEAQKEETASESVEIYRGLNKEKIPLSK